MIERLRALGLLLAYSLLISAMTYLTATNSLLNFLEQRESVNLTLQVSIAVGGLLALVAAGEGLALVPAAVAPDGVPLTAPPLVHRTELLTTDPALMLG